MFEKKHTILRRRKSGDNQSHDRWMLSYADLVTLLLALFIVLYAAADQQRARQIANSFTSQAPQTEKSAFGNGVLPAQNALISENEKIEHILTDNPNFAQIAKVRQTSRGLVVSLEEAGFFQSGEADINAQAEPLIEALANALRDSDKQIRVEGHTDSTPISTARYPSNWELSTARASAVLSRLISQGIAPSRLSASGYGDVQPIADNSTPEGRAQNRRVDLVVLTR